MPGTSFRFNLGEFSGTARLRFRFGTDGADTAEGWYVDDLLIDGFAFELSATGEENGSGLRFALQGSHTNPVSGATDFAFEVPVAVDAQLAVYDVSGRTVRAWDRASYGPGTHRLHWDGRDAGGALVPSGVYFYRLQAGDFTATRMLVMTR